MMNAPPAFKSFLLFESKITINKDSRVPNACLFTINKEDQTLGNIIKSQLLKDSQVLFAGYKVPYPLEHRIIIVCRPHQITAPSRPPPVPLQTSSASSSCWKSNSRWPSKISKEEMGKKKKELNSRLEGVLLGRFLLSTGPFSKH